MAYAKISEKARSGGAIRGQDGRVLPLLGVKSAGVTATPAAAAWFLKKKIEQKCQIHSGKQISQMTKDVEVSNVASVSSGLLM